jgi:hypothetical protein
MVVGYEDKEQLKHDRDKMGSKISKTCPWLGVWDKEDNKWRVTPIHLEWATG